MGITSEVYSKMLSMLSRETRGELAQFALQKQVEQAKPLVPTTEELTVSGNSYYTDIAIESYRPWDVPLSVIRKMKKHGQVNLGLNIIKMPITGLGWHIEGEDQDIVDYTQNIVLKPIFRGLVKGILSGIDYGYSAAEKIWELNRDGDWVYKKIKFLDPLDVKLRAFRDNKFSGFSWKNQVDVPPEKTFFYSHDVDIDNNLYGRSKIKYAYEPWYWLTLIYQFYNRYLERQAIPPIVGKAPNETRTNKQGEKRDCISVMRGIASKLSNDSVAIFPAEYDARGNPMWELKYMQTAEKGMEFIKPIEHLLALILRYMLIPEHIFMQDSKTGSYKMSEVHLSVFKAMETGLISDVINAVNKYIIPQPVELKFGANAPKPELIFEPMEEKNIEVIGDIMKKVIEVTTRGKGIEDLPIDIEKMLSMLNIPLKAIDEGGGEEDEKGEKDKEDKKGQNWGATERRQATGADQEAERQIVLAKTEVARPNLLVQPVNVSAQIQNKINIHCEKMEGYFKEAEALFIEKAGAVIDKQAVEVIGRLERRLEETRDAKEYRGIDIKYHNEYVKVLKNAIDTAHLFGITSAKAELGITDSWVPLPADEKQYGLLRAEILAEKHIADLRYMIAITITNGLRMNRTNKDIIFALREEVGKFKEKHLGVIGRTEIVMAVNRGRQITAMAI